MSLDLTLLRLCTDQGKFNRLVPEAPMEGLDEQTIQLIGALRAFYKEFPDTKKLDMEVFQGWAMEFKFKALADDRKSLLKLQMRNMSEPVPVEVEQGMIERLLSLQLASSVVSTVLRWQEGAEINLAEEIAVVQDAIALRMDRKARMPVVNDTIEDLLKDDENDVGIHWRLAPLAASMRPLRGGDFGIYAMRPDAGKTSFLCSETTFWMPQLDVVWPGQNRTGVWLNNEGPGRNIKKRWIQALLQATIPEMIEWAKDGSLRQRMTDALGGVNVDRMIFLDIHGFSSGEVDQLLKQVNPGFVIYDMIDNITFSGAGNNGGTRTDQMLEGMYQWARNGCVKQDFVGIATSQISYEGENVQYPPQSALKDSKTGKQGACEFIIMGGKLNDAAMDRFRYFGAPKNKLVRAGAKKDPRCEVMFDGDRCIYYTEGVP